MLSDNRLFSQVSSPTAILPSAFSENGFDDHASPVVSFEGKRRKRGGNTVLQQQEGRKYSRSRLRCIFLLPRLPKVWLHALEI